jgi:hypothetical protein
MKVQSKTTVLRPLFVGASILFAATSFIAGCGSTNNRALPSAAPANAKRALRRLEPQVRGAAAKDNLLYVGDSDASIVRVFDYSQKDRPVGQLAIDPFTLCSDVAGDVWVEGIYNGQQGLFEFAHDGSGPIALLNEYGGESCAVDPKSGDLAVVHWGAPSAWVDVFRHAQGSAEKISDPGVTDFYFGAYDNQGDLLIQGMNYVGQGEVVYDELPLGKNKLEEVSVPSVPYSHVGGLAWDGKYFAAGFAEENWIYRYTLKNAILANVNQTEFAISQYGFFGFLVHKHRLTAWVERVNDEDAIEGEVVKFPYPLGNIARHFQPTGAVAGIALSVGSGSI